MSFGTAQARFAAEEAGNWLVTAGVAYVAAYPYLEMFGGGEPVFRLALLALASLVPAFLALNLVLRSPEMAMDASTRRFFPACAALLASASVSYPAYLMTGLPLA